MRRSWPQYAVGAVVVGIVFWLAQLLSAGIDVSVRWPATVTRIGPVKVLSNPYTDDFLDRQSQQHTRILVIAKTKAEDVSWPDELKDIRGLSHAVYVVDDDTAVLHTPANKGHEAMVYLSYIIDWYDNLPDASIFMHSHSSTWHNNDLLERSSAELVRRLSLEKVIREGYVNLRCYQTPGCPGHLRLHKLDGDDVFSEMNRQVAIAFRQLFPGEEVPYTLAQPCCAQFAVSRAAIQQRSKASYIAMRAWLIATQLPDHVSGRIFEFAWQYIFTSLPVLCPSVHLCYCDAYSICFRTQASWQQYHDIATSATAIQQERLKLLEGGVDDRNEELRRLEDGLRAEAERRKNEAFATGSDPEKRQQVLFDAWELLRTDGDLPEI